LRKPAYLLVLNAAGALSFTCSVYVRGERGICVLGLGDEHDAALLACADSRSYGLVL
jgi:hypothetical protein